MPRIDASFVHEAFIAPIRSALVIDDAFPTYGDLADNRGVGSPGSQMAKKLTESFRAMGWLCDVDNGGSINSAENAVAHLHQSDLLVVDLHLDPPPDDRDPNKAFAILQGLAASPHFNMALIYTAEARISQVALQLAYGLGLGETVENSDREILEGYDERVLGKINDALNPLGYAEFLGGRFAAGSVKARDAAKVGGISKGDTQNLIFSALSAEWLERGLTEEVLAHRKGLIGKDGASFNWKTDAGGIAWVQAGNLFVAIVNKEENAPDQLVDILSRALVDWDPSPLKVILVHARAAVERCGVLHDGKILRDGLMQAGWLLKALTGDDGDRPQRIKHLYARLLEELSRNVQDDVAEFGQRILALPEGASPIVLAKDWSQLPPSTEHMKIYHALNKFLCSEEQRDGPITTGTVFKCQSKNSFTYYVCVTPACDLVPEQNKGEWDGEIYPMRHVKAVRLAAVKTMSLVNERLINATHGRYVFVSDGGPIALEFSRDEARKIFREPIFVENKGLISAGEFYGHVIVTVNDVPQVERRRFDVVAKLRSDYANRFLTESGAYDARIGVDFFDAPEVGTDNGQVKS